MLKTFKIKLFLFIASISFFGLSAQNQDVSDTDLAQFADAYINLQVKNQEIEQDVMAVIEKEGLDIEKFNQIQEASMNPEQKNDATPDEMKKHAKVMTKIQEMQPEMEKKAISGIEETGLSLEKYQTLAAAIQQDQGLQQRLQTILMERQKQ